MILLLVAGAPVRAQNEIDSLKEALEETNDNQNRVDILNELSSAIYDTDVTEGFKYASDAYDDATAIKYDRGRRKALDLMSFRYITSGDFQEALKYLRQATTLNTTEDDLVGYGYVMTANVYRSLAKYDSARYFYNRAITLLESYPKSLYQAYAFKSLARLMVIQWNNREAETYFKKAQDIYTHLGYQRGIAEIWFALSDVSKNMTDYQLAETYQAKGCEIANKIKADYLILVCYKNQGDYYFHLGEYLKSLDVLFKGMEILKTKEQPQLLASVYFQLGEVYEELGQHDVSLKYYFDALKIWERIGVKYEMAKLYSEVGWIYKNQLNFAQAKVYMEKSLAIRQEIKDDHGISNSYNVLGVLYYQEGKYEKALALLEKALDIRKRIVHREGVSASIFNIARVYEDLGQYAKALDYQFDALEIDERIGNKQGLSISYNSIGQLYTKAGNFPEAFRYLTKAKELSQQTGSKILIMNNRLQFSQFYEAKGDLAKALEFHKSYTQLNDSIYSEGNALKLAEMHALYQVEQKNQEISFLNQEKEIQQNQILLQRSQIGQQRTIIIAGLIGLILICFFAFKIYQYTLRLRRANREILEQQDEIQTQSEELIEANHTIANINRDLETKIEERTSDLRQAYKELDTFFYRASHDFRRPLTTFLGLAEVANITVKDAYALELFAKVKETASNLDKMLIKLQSISDVGAQQLVYRDVMVKEIVDNVLDSFSTDINERNIRMVTDIDLHEPFYSYPAMIKTIVENLVENAIFFSRREEAVVRIAVFKQGTNVVFEVEDNGQGIDQIYQERIFDMYFRGNDKSKGNGLGLYIVKKGHRETQRTDHLSLRCGEKGALFQVFLPMDQNHPEVIH